MPFDFNHLDIPEVILVTPKKFKDERGFFEETYKRTEFINGGIDREFQQDNHSFSVKGTLRGLHFQNPPNAQGKLVRCLKGKILDIAVDIRKGSPTIGKWVGEILSGDNSRMLWIPEGFAHGFLALEDSHVEYKATNEYSKESEDGIIWNDDSFNINWGIENPLISQKDFMWPSFNKSNSKFTYNEGETEQ